MIHRLLLPLSVAALAAALAPGAARAAESYDNCTGFVAALPAVIATQGTWCFNKDLATAAASGVAIDITANNVALDCNGFKLGNLSAGVTTLTKGIRALGRSNITVRGCTIRGFRAGIDIEGAGGGHVVENNRVEDATEYGVYVEGDNVLVRGNHVTDIGMYEDIAPTAIEVRGTGEVARNSVANVGTPGINTAWGIVVGTGGGFLVRENIVRNVWFDVEGGAGSQSMGIFDGPSTVVGNEITGPDLEGSTGVTCNSAVVTVRDNTVGVHETPISNCTHELDNVLY